jgi:hypothetical protein
MGGIEMTMDEEEEIDIIEAIVKSHRSGEVAFHVAHTRLMVEHGFDSDTALELLFPPMDEDDFDMILPEPRANWE